MNVYMSLWTKGRPIEDERSGVGQIKDQYRTSKDLWKLSLALANKHYGKVHLISDKLGCEFLSDLPFASFSEELENITYFPNMWSLGKVHAYNIASQKGHFLHLDADVFLWETLPEHLVNSDFFAQSPDTAFDSYVYRMDDFKKIPEIWKKYKHNENSAHQCYTYNMGIFGGTDTDNIKKYCEFVFSMVYDPELKEEWSRSYKTAWLIEQGNLGIFLQENNLTINTLLKSADDKENLSYKKYSHLMCLKESEAITRNIAKRLNQNPYDLEPKDIPKERWSTSITAA